MNDTPRTDAFLWAPERAMDDMNACGYGAMVEFARRMERENAALRSTLTEIAREDYRGNRSSASLKAQAALDRL